MGSVAWSQTFCLEQEQGCPFEVCLGQGGLFATCCEKIADPLKK